MLDRALGGDLIAKHENLVMVAAQGLGKTMLARNIAHEAVLSGYSALFVEASKMLLDLAAQESARALERKLAHHDPETGDHFEPKWVTTMDRNTQEIERFGRDLDATVHCRAGS